MKEKLYTIPMIDAVAAKTECPFCYIQQKIEEDTLDFVLGSSASYMERDIRAITDEKGFCREHFKKMFEYGNSLGNGWILKTHYMRKMEELKKAFQDTTPGSNKKKFSLSKQEIVMNPVSEFAKKEKESCYICEQMQKSYDRYLETFIILYTKDENFKKNVLESQGFCISHLGDLCTTADAMLKTEQLKMFYQDMEELTMKNMQRMFEDVSWLIEKYDYRNREADWKNSKDAVPRGMQKLKGGF
ncbi:MAG: DUF6062 family protein [Eubacteriales bacterium]